MFHRLLVSLLVCSLCTSHVCFAEMTDIGEGQAKTEEKTNTSPSRDRESRGQVQGTRWSRGETKKYRYQDEFDGGDYAQMALWSGLGVVGTGLITMIAASKVDCSTRGDNAKYDLGISCAFDLLGAMSISALGYILLIPTGVYIGGQLAGYEGSWWRTLGSSFLGLLAGGLLSQAVTKGGSTSGLIAGLTVISATPILTGIMGYKSSVRERPAKHSNSLSLFDYNPDDGLRVGIPAIVVRQQDHDTRFELSLFGGRF